MSWQVPTLAAIGVLLAWPVPRWLPNWRSLRTVPRSALLLWQAVSLGAVLSTLLLAGVAMGTGRSAVVLGGGLLAGLVVLRLLVTGHLIGTALRTARRRHRDLVDLIAQTQDPKHPDLRVIEHATPTAYCVPGQKRRVVLSVGTLSALSTEELAGVLAHEQAHLRARHDLVLEFFTVWHTAVPQRVRSDAGLREVRLLIEILADAAAVRVVGARTLGRALMALARSENPAATMGAGSAVLARMEALGELSTTGSRRLRAGAVLLLAVLILLTPLLVAVSAPG